MKKKVCVLVCVCVLFCVCVLTGCRSSESVRVVERVLHDTLVSNVVRYDSVFIDQVTDVRRERDTVFRDRNRLEYRLRMVHDTTLVSRRDTIPITVVTDRPVRFVPLWCKWFGGFGVLCLLAGGVIIARLAGRRSYAATGLPLRSFWQQKE